MEIIKKKNELVCLYIPIYLFFTLRLPCFTFNPTYMRNIVLCCLFCCCQLLSSGQSQQLYFNFLGVKDGLPEGTMNSLLQDKYGYMWIGTQNGLVRFDGYQTKIYPLKTNQGVLSNILSIYEDSHARLWIGTYSEGLYYYDRSADQFISCPFKGKITETYAIRSMLEDSNGNLWVTGRNLNKSIHGLFLFDTKTKQSRSFGKLEKGIHFINAGTIYDLFKDAYGSIWVGSNNGLYRYLSKEDRFEGHLISDDSTQQKGIWKITQDSIHPDVLWTNGWFVHPLKDEGVWRYNIKDHSLKKFMHEAGNPASIMQNEVFSIENFQKGYLWIGCDTGLSLLNTQTNRFENYIPADNRHNSDDNIITAMKKDAAGNLWCQASYGLLFFDTTAKKFTRYTSGSKNAVGMQSSYVRNLLLTKNGMLWIGAEQIGLQWLNTERSRFTLYKNNPGQLHHFTGGAVNDFAETADGTIWISSASGLYRWQSQTDSFNVVHFEQKSMNDVYANSVVTDKEGLVWSRIYGNAGMLQGIYCYNPKTGKSINYRHNPHDSTSLVDDNVRAMYMDHEDVLWIGTFGHGLCSFDKRTGVFTNYPYINNEGLNGADQPRNGALDDDQVQSIYEDAQGNIWVGTNNGNLNKLNRQTKTFTSFNRNIPGFSTIMSIHADKSSTLWVGAYMSGLYRFDKGNDNKYHRYTEADGLLYNGCWGINEDADGNLWIASPRGISVLNPSTNHIRNISTANGFPGEPVSFSLFKTSKALFLTGCKEGFIAWNPKDLIPDTSAIPIVHIEALSFTKNTSGKAEDSSIVVFDKNNLQLHHNENRITFHYVALQYQSPGTVRYVYQLQGYDKDWVEAEADRDATYTNLSPGTYTFFVKARNSDGIWSEKTATLTFTIAPPWWKTWWAYLLYTLLLVTVVSAVIAYRSARLRSENKLLEEKVEERTHQLNESLAGLKAAQNQLVHAEKMASLGELTAGIAHEIQNPLNFVNNFSELNNELVGEMRQEIDEGNLEEVKAIADDIALNSRKISQHGKRADAIIKGMLQHSRKSSGQKELTDINALVDEYLRLSYHGLRAKDAAFSATMQTSFDDHTGKLQLVPQDMGRVLLNLFNNAFYAVNEKKKTAAAGYQPNIKVTTQRLPSAIEITVEDNGGGIPASVADKIFQPFFTTKPTGQGTGLGLSLSYDIVTKEHHGKIELHNREGEGAAFVITLPV